LILVKSEARKVDLAGLRSRYDASGDDYARDSVVKPGSLNMHDETAQE